MVGVIVRIKWNPNLNIGMIDVYKAFGEFKIAKSDSVREYLQGGIGKILFAELYNFEKIVT
jgi:hypothetical protein